MHLSSEEALDLIEARAVEDQIRFWNYHVQTCSSCRQQLAAWKEMRSLLKRENVQNAPQSAIKMADAIFEPRQATEPQGLRQLIASVVFDSFAQPALAGARGASAARQLLLTAEGFDVHIRLWKAGQARRIAGQISSRGEQSVVPRIQVHLLEDGKRVNTTGADDFGEFEFAEVPEGSLQIQVELPDLTITGALHLDS
jgi:hypothetical protein